MNALIEARAVSREFVVGQRLFAAKPVIRAVIDVDLMVSGGEVLGIVGESGSGKSTLGKMLLGLLRPDRGTIRIGGEDLIAIERRRMARLIQPVFQDPYSSLNPRKRVAAIVALPLAVLGIGSAKERRARATAMLERVGLSARFGDGYSS